MAVLTNKDIEFYYGKEVAKATRLNKKIITKQPLPKFTREEIEVTKFYTSFTGLLMKKKCNENTVFSNCNYYDANSMYPSMLDNKFIYPAGKLVQYKYNRETIDELYKIFDNQCWLCSIWISDMTKIKKIYKDLDYDMYLKSSIDKTVINGEIKPTKFGNCLPAANDNGFVINLNNVSLKILFDIYDINDYEILNIWRYTDIYKFDPEVMNELKLEKNAANELKMNGYITEAEIIKRGLNKTCFGKLAARDYKTSIALGQMVYASSYPIGAYVAANAQLVEWEHIKAHINNFIYADTDSIVLQNDELENKYVGTELGKYKYEYKNFDFKIKAFKNYEIWKDGKLLKKTLQDRKEYVDDINVHNNMKQILDKIKKHKYDFKNNFVKNDDLDFDNDLEEDDDNIFDNDVNWIGDLQLDEFGNVIDDYDY